MESSTLKDRFISEMRLHLASIHLELVSKLKEIIAIPLPNGAEILQLMYHCAYFKIYGLPITVDAVNEDSIQSIFWSEKPVGTWILEADPSEKLSPWHGNTEFSTYDLAVRLTGEAVFSAWHETGIKDYSGNVRFIVFEEGYAQLDIKTGVWNESQ